MFANIHAIIISSSALVAPGKNTPRPGVKRFLQTLRSRGVKTALCITGIPSRFSKADVTAFGPFHYVLSRAETRRAGGEGRCFVTAATRIGIHPFNCMVFTAADDSTLRAHALSMKCIGVGEQTPGPGISETISSYTDIDVDSCIEMARIKPVPAEPWAVTEEGYQPGRAGFWEAVFALSNGHIGIRGTQDESYSGENPGCYVNGFYETMQTNLGCLDRMDAPDEFQLLVNHPDWRIIRVKLDDEWFDVRSGDIVAYTRQLNLREGVLTRSVRWKSRAGKTIDIHSVRLVSMTRRHSALSRMSVTPVDFSGTITFESLIVGRQKTVWIGEKATQQHETVTGVDGNCFSMTYSTPRSGMRAALACCHVVHGAGSTRIDSRVSHDNNRIQWTVSLPVKKGVSVGIDKHVALTTSLFEDSDPVERAIGAVADDAAAGFDRLYREQDDFFTSFWQSGDVGIEGNVADQQSMRFNLFHLGQSHPHDNVRSIPATGLTGDNYLGWIFWDTEVFMAPFFLYTEPEQVKSLLLYRYHTLTQARRRARLMLGPGASFPWSTINGLESAVDFLAAYAQYHINSDIACTIKRYVDATNDTKFLYEYGAEILFETARYMASVGAFIPERDNKYCVNFVCGPDEYNFAVNNNCYTNMMLREHLTFACSVYESMRNNVPRQLRNVMKKTGCTAKDIDFWHTIIDNMFIPFHEHHGIHEQDDGYLYRDPADMTHYPIHYGGYVWRDFSHRDEYLIGGSLPVVLTPLTLGRLQVTKQADVVLLMLLLGEQFSREVKKANYEFYEPKTLHASSLSPAIHSIIASEIGYDDHAYDYFRQSALMDLYDLKGNTSSGIHLACAGSAWMAVVNGFAGMRDYPDGLHFSPVVPGAWTGYSFSLRYRSRNLRVVVAKNRATFTLQSGRPLSFFIYGKKVSLSGTKRSVSVGLKNQNV